MKIKAFKATEEEIKKFEKTAKRYHKGNFSKMIRSALTFYVQELDRERREKRLASSNS